MLNDMSKIPRPTRVHILQHQGRSFVTGLRWHPLGSITGHMKEARQYGRDHQLDIVAIRRTPAIIQAGFVARSDGVTKGMYSLAATLAGQLGESWIAAWQTTAGEDRYALVAVFQGGVISGCDMVGSGAEIRRRVAQQRSRGIMFTDEYLPTEFEMGGQPIDIDELLQPSRLKRAYRLKPLAFGLSRPELVRAGLVVFLICAGAVGWTLWNAHQEEIARQAAARVEALRLAELARLEKEAGVAQPLEALEHPWAKRPSVQDFLSHCSEAIYQLPLAIQGWQFSNTLCNGVQVVTSYTRSGTSTADDLIAATLAHFPEGPVFYDEGKTAVLKLDMSIPAAGDEPLGESIEVLAHLSSWLHSFSQQPTLKEVVVHPAAQPALPGQPAPAPPPPPQWKHYELRFATGITPLDSLRGAPAQGLRLREIKTEYQGGVLLWSVTGDLYAK